MVYCTSTLAFLAETLTVPASEPKPKGQNSNFKQVVRIQNGLPTGVKSVAQARVAAAKPAAGADIILPEPVASAQEKSDNKAKFKVAFTSLTADTRTLEGGRLLCDLYYKGTPWQSELKKSFSDATSALSHFALRHMLTEKPDCSNTLLWTSEIQTTNLRVNQNFTVYPLTEGPKRTEIQRNYNLHWAIIAFTDGSSSATTKTDLRKEDERLTMAIRKISSMGYHIDVWTYLDDDGWDVDFILAEAELARSTTEEKHLRSPPRSLSVFFDTQHLERRRRYEVFARHGVAGFFKADLDFLDKLQSRIFHPERLSCSHLQNGAGSELMGFLEHMEETIVELD